MQAELALASGYSQKLRLCSLYAKIIAKELLGTITLIPYGIAYASSHHLSANLHSCPQQQNPCDDQLLNGHIRLIDDE